ncbi:Tobamovirus multiplication protein 1 [Citrus sinensis]|nr:Tobamovirus multiplication protein 1 [Citrus sinensis]
MTKTKSILNRKIEIESVNANANANDWWNKINESDEWQSGIFYALCAAYVLVSLVALVQLVRIQLRLPNYGWTIQKVFHLMNFIVNGLRAILFGLYKRVFLLRPKELEMVLLDLPSLLCFSTYTLLVLFSAEIYHQARSLSTNKLRPAYYIVNAIVYFIQIYVRLSQSHASVRVKKLYEVGFVTGIFCTCFLIRCIAVAVSAFEKSADFDVLNNPILHLIYYMFSNFFNPIRRK